MYAGNFWLTLPQMTVNAQYILDFLQDRGWTKNAICGMLGNMQTESTINPAIWQGLDEGDTSEGFGLVQWTPATKYLNWCTARGYAYDKMDSNLLRIIEEVETDTQWGNDSLGNPPPFSFEGFTHSTLSAYNLGMLFLRHYERPEVYNQPIRGEQAQYWFNTLTGDNTGGNGGSGYIPTKSKSFFNYISKRRIVIK